MSILINLFGGPGAGKTTLAHGIVYEFRMHGIEADIATEYPKELIYDRINPASINQYTILAEQFKKIERVLRACTVVVCECPLLLCAEYDMGKRHIFQMVKDYETYLKDTYKTSTYNYFVDRIVPYTTTNRVHTEKQAIDIDRRLLGYANTIVSSDRHSVVTICNEISTALTLR